MKKILSAIVLCCSIGVVNAQSADNTQARIEDNNHNVLGLVKTSGTIYEKSGAMICQIKSNGTVLDGKSIPMAYITQEGTIQDMKHNTIGYVNGTGFDDVNHKAVFTVKPDGAILNTNNSVVGYEMNTEPMWAGLYFFLFKR